MQNRYINILSTLVFIFCGFTTVNSQSKIENLFATYVVQNKVDYTGLRSEKSLLKEIKTWVEDYDYSALSEDEQHAHLINAYNFLVIDRIMQFYPIKTVNEVKRFFNEKLKIGNKELSLNELEAFILDSMEDASVHLLLNCGANSCPSVQFIDAKDFKNSINRAIQNNLGQKEIKTTLADKNAIGLSKIFFWYTEDFEKYNGGVESFLKKHGHDSNGKFHYLIYDWALNDQVESEKLKRFYPVRLYQKGQLEIKLFNNYYTQSDLAGSVRNRSSYYAGFFQFLFGTDKKLNWGFDIKLRSVELLSGNNSPLFHALNFRSQMFGESPEQVFSRSGISMFGPRIKYQPFKNKGNINFLHAVYISTMSDAQGNNQYGFTDFDGLQIYNQMYYEINTKGNQTLFIDVGFHLEGMKKDLFSGDSGFGQFLWPVTAIYSWYPTNESTIYTLINGSPRLNLNRSAGQLNSSLDSFFQIGGGAKYYVTDRLEIEFLYTKFFNGVADQNANTFNVGFRYNN